MKSSLLTNHPKLIAALALLFKMIPRFDCFIIARSKSSVWWIMKFYIFILTLFCDVKDKERRVQYVYLLQDSCCVCVWNNRVRDRCVCTTGGYRHTGTWLGPHRKCAFHLLFLQVASVQLVIDTSFLADNTWGLNQHFPPVKLFPLFCDNVIVGLTPRTYLLLSA